MRLGSIAEVAVMLNVTERTVRNYVNGGRLRAYRVGPTLIKIDKDELRSVLTPIEPSVAS
jgi:excisionase family DNA binding protein